MSLVSAPIVRISVMGVRQGLAIVVLLVSGDAFCQNLSHAEYLAKSTLVTERLEAVKELSKIGAPSAFCGLESLLLDRDASIRCAAATSLQALYKSFRDSADNALSQSRDDGQRREAEKVLSLSYPYQKYSLMGKRLIPTLDVLVDPNPERTRKLICDAAKEIGLVDTPIPDNEEPKGKCGTPYLEEDFQSFSFAINRRSAIALEMLKDQRVGFKSALIQELAGSKLPSVLSQIKEFLGSKNSALRYAATQALMSYGPKEYDTISKMAHDPNCQVRYMVSYAIGMFDVTRAKDQSIAFLDDPSDAVAACSVANLLQSNDARIAPNLLLQLGHAKGWRLQNFLLWLREHPSTDFIDPIVKLLNDPKCDAPQEAIESLAKMPGSRIRSLVFDYAKDSRLRVKRGVIGVCSEWNTPESWEVLVELLNDSDDLVVFAAAEGLGDRKVASAIPALERLRAKNPEMVTFLGEIIQQIKTPNTPPPN